MNIALISLANRVLAYADFEWKTDYGAIVPLSTGHALRTRTLRAISESFKKGRQGCPKNLYPSFSQRYWLLALSSRNLLSAVFEV